jgi:hypothetical protein
MKLRCVGGHFDGVTLELSREEAGASFVDVPIMRDYGTVYRKTCDGDAKPIGPALVPVGMERYGFAEFRLPHSAGAIIVRCLRPVAWSDADALQHMLNSWQSGTRRPYRRGAPQGGAEVGT